MLPRTSDARFYGALGYTEPLRDFGIRELIEESQFEHFALTLWQFVEEIARTAQFFTHLQNFFELTFIGHRVQVFDPGRNDGASLRAFPIAICRHALELRDSEQPRRHPTAALVTIGAAPHLEEDIRDDFFGE